MRIFNDNKPLLSIITINRNNAEGLRKTMQSVFDLTFTDFEYIIIDGASSDGSVEVVKDFLANNDYSEKITYWITEPDTGIYNAMNKGLNHAKGKLVCMMNSGDCFVKDALEKLPQWEKNNPGAVLHGAISKYKDGVFIGCEGQSSIFIDTTPLCHQATFVPMLLHEKFGFYDDSYKIYGDYEFWNRLKRNNASFVWINQIICNFDATGVSSIYNKKRWKEKEKIQKLYGTFHKNYIKQFIKQFIPYGFLCLFKNLHSKS
ncbi:MAG: glycosyltransferase [Treponema sp.]|uniref:glycosyltransferase family 2 protein n=1 Tax=Treponema sp. TaxID=166 RepID=UPI0025FDCE6B|nr:glycosyltransferase family 2 protein [Treponema sp.]MBQ8679083.1 glycosyltransferase [Treponema sp.]